MRLVKMRQVTLVGATIALTVACCVVQTLGQVSEDDGEFQAYHQDIGRISGRSNVAQVAPQTTLVERPPPEAVVVNPSAAPVQPQRAAASRQLSATGSRKPNRITLVARRDPLPSASAALGPLVAARPQAQPQPLESSFAPVAPPPLQVAAQQQQSVAFQGAGPALASFRGTNAVQGAPSDAPLARHSGERAAAASQQQPALGPPPLVEALPPPPPPSSVPLAPVGLQPALESANFVAAPSNQDEPIVAPSFEQVLGSGCPHKGVFSWENKDHCDRYYMCTNGTFTEEACPNGLAYNQMGAVYQHCAYNWNVECGPKKSAQPIASPGCPWQFGIFPILQNGRCSIDYYVCEWGVPEPKRCSPEGLFYDDRIKGCQWADQLGCKSEALLNFKCPSEDEENPYWPYPRYYHNTQDVIVCVNEQPRLVHCTEEQLVDPASLACVDVKKKKKKQF